jgi:hypothetical protein
MIRRLMPGLINVIPKTSIKELTLFGICSEVIGDGQGGRLCQVRKLKKTSKS